MEKTRRTSQIRFTQTNLKAVVVPEGRPNVEVQDEDIKALRCRISSLGKMTMFLDVKVGGKHVKRTLGSYIPGPGGKTVDDFREQARAELHKIDDDAASWLEGGQDVETEPITIESAFSLALKASKRGAMAKRDWNEAKTKFINWMKANYPYVETWTRLRRQHVKEYLEAQTPTEENVKRGITELSPTRRRLLLQPVAQTARFMWHEHDIPNVAERLGLSAKLVKTPAPVYLADVLAFLQYLRGSEQPQLEAGAALAGLAGLQLLEVLRLTWSKVDLKRGLIEISGEVKNQYRNRVIPIPRRCVEALQQAYDNRRASTVQTLDGGPVVASPQGCPFLDKSWINYSHLMRKALDGWNQAIGWKPKDLRNCLLTLGALRGFASDVLEQYVGHAPRSVTARNYLPRLGAASIGEAAALENQMKVFKTLVVEHMESEIKALVSKGKRKGAAVVNLRKNA